MNTPDDIHNYGKRLLPYIVDERARVGYERPYAIYPISRDPMEGLRSVSYARLSNAVNRACWWLESVLSEEQKKDSAFAYLGPNDLRYAILVLASIKTGRKILISSLRNTIDAELSLFERVNCKVLVSCSSLNRSLQPLFAASEDVQKVQAPELEELLAEDSVSHYDYNKTFETAGNDTIIHIHTSGSSGNPKPIHWNKVFLASMDSGHILPVSQGISLTKSFVERQNVLSLLPCFHAGGLAFNLFPAIYDMTLVLGHPDVPMSAHYVSQILAQGVVTSLLTPPSILEDLSNNTSSLEHLTHLKHIGYGGGPLKPDIGNMLAPIVPHIFSFIGATENGWFHNVSGADNRTWDSLRFYSDIGYQFDEVSEGLFEFVIVNDPRTNKYHGIFEVFPDLKEYRLRDLYTRNPDHPGWMRYHGRSDDLIVLSNGEKVNPIPMENIISSQPQVQSALIVGEYRFNPSLLVELEEDKIPKTDAERRFALDQLWPSIQEANKIAPGFAKVPKSLVLFASAEKPFLRAGKGTVQRQLTGEAYSKELEDVFTSQEADLLIEGLTLHSPASPENIKTFIREIYSQALEEGDLTDSDDVFHRGMNSLKVAVIASRLQAALKSCGFSSRTGDISPRLIYSKPSIENITQYVLGLAYGRGAHDTTNGIAGAERRDKLEGLVEKFSAGIVSEVRGSVDAIGSSPEAWDVILTGTTGSLGSHLLATLEAMPTSKINKIYCLNRSFNGKSRQEKSNTARGLRFSLDQERIEFLQADFSRPDLGLGLEKYTELLGKTTVLIHSAWQVDFNLTVESFEPQIRGVRNLLDFTAKSAYKAPLISISSISTALNWLDQHPNSKVPEAVINDFDAPEQIGYGESKFVSEHIIERYAKAAGINAAIFRTGQIAGSLSGKGVWNKQEWFPSLVTSSKHLSLLPETLGGMEVVDWVPVDLLASVMIELTENIIRQSSKASGTTSVYNLVNPQATTWSDLCTPVQHLAGIPQTVPLKEWVALLEGSSKKRSGAFIDANPAVKLLDFYRLMCQKDLPLEMQYEVKSLVRDSETAANLEAVKSEWIQLWMSRWG